MLDAKNMRIRKRQERLSPLLPREGVKEDLSLLGGFFAKGKRSPAERRNYFRKKENLKKYSFSPEYEYTFEFYQVSFSFFLSRYLPIYTFLACVLTFILPLLLSIRSTN